MGVRLRVSRNASVYVPFWLAIPAYMLWLGVMACVVVILLLVNLCLLAGRGVGLAIKAVRNT